MRERHSGDELTGSWSARESASDTTTTPIRYCAVSMELAAYLDDRYVEMHILTDTGQTISVVCESDSIFAVQRHIERLGKDCPEIATWKSAATIPTLRDNGHGSYALALDERRRRMPGHAYPMLSGADVRATPTSLHE
jgi:hypothetical protein